MQDKNILSELKLTAKTLSFSNGFNATEEKNSQRTSGVWIWYVWYLKIETFLYLIIKMMELPLSLSCI